MEKTRCAYCFAQFAARFEFDVAEETVEICRGMQLQALSRERIEGELKKALLKAEKPSVFFETLRRMGQLSVWFPEMEALIDVPQSPKHHAEGDVWTHTMMVIDAAAGLREACANPMALMLAAAAHDFGKAVTTEAINGEIHAYGHEEKGLPIALTAATNGLVLCCTVVGIPWGLQCFKLAKLALMPFGADVIHK